MPVSRKIKAIRRHLLNTASPSCFYCGLPFHAFVLPKGTPGARLSRAYVQPTLEHLLPLSLQGQTTAGNCVLAHSWCNVKAANKPVEEKLQLKQQLSGLGILPWWPSMNEFLLKQNQPIKA